MTNLVLKRQKNPYTVITIFISSVNFFFFSILSFSLFPLFFLIPLPLPLILSLSKRIHSPPSQASVSLVHASFLHSGAWVWWLWVVVWVVFAVVVRFLVVGFGLLMIFLVGSDVVGLFWVCGFFFFFFGSFGRRWWWESDVCVVCFGFWGFFFSLGFVASCGFQWWWWFPVWGGFAMEDAMAFWIWVLMLWFGWVLWLVVVVADLRLARESRVLAVRIKGTTKRESGRAGLWERKTRKEKCNGGLRGITV